MAATHSVIGAADVDATQVGNVGAGEDDLITFTLPAASLHTNGMGVRVTAWGITANNANAKTLRVYFGASLATIGLDPSINGQWKVTLIIVRTGAATQEAWIDVISATSTANTPEHFTFVLAPTQTLSGAIVIKMTGQATASDDIIQRAMITELITRP